MRLPLAHLAINSKVRFDRKVKGILKECDAKLAYSAMDHVKKAIAIEEPRAAADKRGNWWNWVTLLRRTIRDG